MDLDYTQTKTTLNGSNRLIKRSTIARIFRESVSRWSKDAMILRSQTTKKTHVLVTRVSSRLSLNLSGRIVFWIDCKYLLPASCDHH